MPPYVLFFSSNANPSVMGLDPARSGDPCGPIGYSDPRHTPTNSPEFKGEGSTVKNKKREKGKREE